MSARSLFLILLVSLPSLASCSLDDEIADALIPDCPPRPAMNLQGTWNATLLGSPLTLQLTEGCAPPSLLIVDASHWVATGTWQWLELTGAADMRWGNVPNESFLLYRGARFSSLHVVRLIIPAGQLPAGTRLQASIVGSWPTATDPGEMQVTIDSMAIELIRRP